MKTKYFFDFLNRHGIKITSAARHMGCSASTIREWRGKENVSYSLIQKAQRLVRDYEPGAFPDEQKMISDWLKKNTPTSAPTPESDPHETGANGTRLLDLS